MRELGRLSAFSTTKWPIHRSALDRASPPGPQRKRRARCRPSRAGPVSRWGVTCNGRRYEEYARFASTVARLSTSSIVNSDQHMIRLRLEAPKAPSSPSHPVRRRSLLPLDRLVALLADVLLALRPHAGLRPPPRILSSGIRTSVRCEPSGKWYVVYYVADRSRRSCAGM